MKILREDITSDGLRATFVDSSVKPGDLAEKDVLLAIIRPPRATFMLMPMANGLVRVEGSFSATLQLCCSRCLSPLSFELQDSLRVVFKPAPFGLEEEIMLSRGDMEVYFYDGVELDLGEVLRSELSLLIPFAPVCEGACAALCATCGLMPCQCGQKQIDPRWSKLAGLKFD